MAIQTRKGTGYYKVPSLKGLWYRGHYLHDGSAESLEEMFDPDRLKEEHVPGGWTPLGTKARGNPRPQVRTEIKSRGTATTYCILAIALKCERIPTFLTFWSGTRTELGS